MSKRERTHLIRIGRRFVSVLCLLFLIKLRSQAVVEMCEVALEGEGTSNHPTEAVYQWEEQNPFGLCRQTLGITAS